jgi:hypothetical protein
VRQNVKNSIGTVHDTCAVYSERRPGSGALLQEVPLGEVRPFAFGLRHARGRTRAVDSKEHMGRWINGRRQSRRMGTDLSAPGKFYVCIYSCLYVCDV